MGGHYVKALVFQPPAVTTFPPSSGDKSNSRLPWLTLHTSQGGLIPALFINTQSKITILFSHGNAEDLGMCYDWLVEMSKALEVNIFAYEYEGYGKARSFQHFDSSQQELSQSSSSLLPTTAAYQAHKSSPSEEHCYQDIQTAFDYLTTSLQIASEHIVVFGRSLGSGPSLYLAELLAKQNINLGGIILQVSSLTL